MHHRSGNSLGTTLTEMLVVVVILCAGMITVAGMLNESINSLTHNMHRQRAAQLSANMAEVLAGIHADASWPLDIPADHRCAIVTCGKDDFLANAMHHWQEQIARQLPGGRGEFQFTDQNGQAVALVRLEWRTRGAGSANFVTLIPVTTLAATL